MLELKDVKAGYGGPDIIKNISFTVRQNENLMIIGPNGCGKSTLLKVIAGLLPFRGYINIDDKDIRKMKRGDISRKIAILSQSSDIYFSYTVFDTVMMGRYLHMTDKLLGLPSSADKERVTECLKAVDLLAERDKEITKLSGGQLQRVFLARTLAQDPDIILLDEPTNHLDLKYQFELIEYLSGWSKQGRKAVIGVLHDLNLAMRLGGSFLVLKDGRSKAQGPASEIITADLLREVYDMDVAGYMAQSLKVWERMG